MYKIKFTSYIYKVKSSESYDIIPKKERKKEAYDDMVWLENKSSMYNLHAKPPTHPYKTSNHSNHPLHFLSINLYFSDEMVCMTR